MQRQEGCARVNIGISRGINRRRGMAARDRKRDGCRRPIGSVVACKPTANSIDPRVGCHLGWNSILWLASEGSAEVQKCTKTLEIYSGKTPFRGGGGENGMAFEPICGHPVGCSYQLNRKISTGLPLSHLAPIFYNYQLKNCRIKIFS